MEVFVTTVSITLGILLPLVGITAIFAIFIIIRDALQYRTAKATREAEEWKKRAPFDEEAKFYDVPNPTMQGIILYKNNEEVWRGAIDKER